jgi:hypothetical protein
LDQNTYVRTINGHEDGPMTHKYKREENYSIDSLDKTPFHISKPYGVLEDEFM